ncbi:MAG: carboxypeptidase-like regulatory domain-containing protein, partial [Nanoarchaeota archaeon]
DCTGINAETGKNCNSDCYDCVSGSCTAMTENNDASCNDDCTRCNAGTCINRNACDSAECSADKYCNIAGGDCKTPDENENVCLNCVSDATSGYPWTWSPSNHQDAGKSYSTNTDVYTKLFDSNTGACPATSCSKAGNDCHCYDSNNNNIGHKDKISTGDCCGDDTSEYYKPDYYAGECANDVNDCIWSTGEAQYSDTGNAQWWCYLHEWNECTDSAIGAKVGGVTCAGIVGNNAWIPNALVKPENQYSCIDGKDNDGDGLIDCADPDCNGNLNGKAVNQDNQLISFVDITAKKDLIPVKSVQTAQDGTYTMSIGCGDYNVMATHSYYAPQTKTNINVKPNQPTTVDFNLVLGTSCESDCTYASDNLVHASCDGKNGCGFYDATAKAACDLSQPGWVREYDATHYVVCAPGSPQLKVEIHASLSCASGTIIKATRIVVYNGKPVKLVVAACR